MCALPGTLQGRSLFEVLQAYPELSELAGRLLGGERLEFVSVAHAPYQLEVWGVPVRTPAGEPAGAAGIVVDISARVAAERAVLDAARREMALVEHASDVILVVDVDGVVRSVNPAAHRLLRHAWTSGETLRLESVVHPEDHDRVRRHFAGAIGREGSTAPIEYRIGHFDGSWRTVESIVNNMVGDPAVNGFVVTLRDVTSRRENEERLASNAGRQAALADLGRWALVGLPYADLVDDAVNLLAGQFGRGLRAPVRGDAGCGLRDSDGQCRSQSLGARTALERPHVLARELRARHPADRRL